MVRFTLPGEIGQYRGGPGFTQGGESAPVSVVGKVLRYGEKSGSQDFPTKRSGLGEDRGHAPSNRGGGAGNGFEPR